MSSTQVTENVVDEAQVGVPPGDYRLIAWDLDLTGRRLSDEICQISAYLPGDDFSQYVMPYRKPNPAAQHRHSIRVVTIGRYRVMKSTKTGKILRTKSEISALYDFIAWLEKCRAKDGVILLSYETRKVVPHILLEALRRYNLLDTFSATVKGFANGYGIAEKKSAKPFSSYSLHTVSRHLLDRDSDELATTLDRAKLAYEVIQHVLAPETPLETNVGGGDNIEVAIKELSVSVCEHALTVVTEEAELSDFKALQERQTTLRPVFGPMIQKNRRERQRASVQRQLIAEAGLDYVTLAEAFKENGKEGISLLMTTKLTQANSKIKEELLNVLVEHFDPPPISEKVIADEESAVKQNGVPITKQNGTLITQQNGKEKETNLEDKKTDDDEGVSSSADTGTSSPVNRCDSGSESLTTSSPPTPQKNVKVTGGSDTPVASKLAVESSPEH